MSGLENENESHMVSVIGFKHHGGLKMRIQLPDYDDFRRCDLGAGGNLSQIAHKIDANIHKPSWGILKHRMFMAEIAKKISEEPKAVAENDKKGDFKQGRMYGW